MKAMLFAAGLGTRLGSYTKNAPKALVDVAGKSVLRHNIEKLHNSGFTDIIVNLHHFPDLVENEITQLRREGFRITVSDESDRLLDTGGGLWKARWFFDDEPFLLYNTDIITSLNLQELYRFHNYTGGIATLAVRKRSGSRFLLQGRDGLLKGWCNRATGEVILPVENPGECDEVGFSGIHIVNPAIFNYMQEGIYSLTNLYLEVIKKELIHLYRHDRDNWWDIGTPAVLEEVRNNFSGY